MLRFRPIVASVLALIFAACADPAGLDHLAINVALGRNKMMSGDTTTVVVRFTNTGSDAIDLQLFCQNLFEVANADGEIVAGHEAMTCVTLALGPERLGPRESIERRFLWAAQFRQQIGDTLISGPLPPGTYQVYGKVEQRRSAPTVLELEPRVPPQ
ncbi:MAG TPA: hypothetical protein VKC15_17725 [Gemmatimonadales bacterium]|nr:hypothetical protein [Gemmatimonadales bacterium]